MSGTWACSPEVRRALARGWPVVALESLPMTGALATPERFDVVCELESIAREEGACPATIAVVDGAVRVGLPPAELDRVVDRVAASASLARLAGIRVLASTLRDPSGTRPVTVAELLEQLSRTELAVARPLDVGGGLGGYLAAVRDAVRLAARAAVVWAEHRAGILLVGSAV